MVVDTMPRTLDDWLSYQQQIHPAGIALGLERLREVAGRLPLGPPARCVITVAGTNGKGSTVAFIEAIARAAGHRVGCYTSPHLQRYNERVRIDGIEASDEALIAAFERIEAARGDTPLTYFEFGTLAALLVFERAGLDLAVLEVGLGGRLDAVNLIDADVAVVTTIALDHMDWLGNDLESIGREKAGVFRAGHPAVLGDPAMPASVAERARELGAPLRRAGHEFRCVATDDGLRYLEDQFALTLPAPALRAACQPANVGAAICALRALAPRLPIAPAAFATGVATAALRGRLERIERNGVELLFDVAHNPQAAGQLAEWLRRHPPAGRTLAVFSALADKDQPALVAALGDSIDRWHIAGLPDAAPRGLPIEALWSRLAGVLPAHAAQSHRTVAEALAATRAEARGGDRIVVFGSFHTVGEALRQIDDAERG
jgi:dihydrofolate synthase / folylpolyglutamate synthase